MQISRSLFTFSRLSLSLALSSAIAAARPPLPADEFGATLTISGAANSQRAPAVAYNPACDCFLVVWQDRRNGIDDDVWGRYVDGSGEALLGTFNLTPGRTGNQSAPAVAYDPCLDQFLVVWMDDLDGNWDIRGQTFNCSKSSTSPLISIAVDPASQQYPDVDCAYGLAWVVWGDRRNANLDVYGQIVLPGGGLDGANVSISELQAKEQSFPSIAMNPREDTGCSLYSFLVAWRDLRGGSSDIFSHQVSDLGRCWPIGDTGLYTGATTQSMPDLVYGVAPLEGNDRYLCVWQDHRSGNADIYGRLVLPNGTPFGASGAISSGPSEQRLPAVAFSGADDQFLCVFEDWSSGNANIVGRRVSLAGALVGASLPFAINAAAELAPAISWSSSEDHYLVVWERTGDIDARAYWN